MSRPEQGGPRADEARLPAGVEAELAALEAAGRLRRLPDEAVAPARDFTSNDYLDLARDPRVVAAARQALERHGAGGRAARLLGGGAGQAALELEVATWLGAEAALLFPSGYQANLGLLTSLAGPEDVLFSDRLNHASLIDGARLAKARVAVFEHNDMADLERALVRSAGARRRLVVVEGIFSMDGDRAPLEELEALCHRHDAWLLVDEAHAAGLIGAEGRGAAAELAALADSRLLARTITGGKAFGGGGALVVGPRALIDLATNRARSFIFTTAPSPALVAGLGAAIGVARSDARLRGAALGAARRLASALGLEQPAGAIVPIPIGDERAALAAAGALAERGFDVRAVRPPTVPVGTSRLRVVTRASHTPAAVDDLVAALGELGIAGAKSRTPAEVSTASERQRDLPVGAAAQGDPRLAEAERRAAAWAAPSVETHAAGQDLAAGPRSAPHRSRIELPAATPEAPVLFVAGTDTDVGKTVVAALLCRALARRDGATGVHYWKPVQTGDDSDSATVRELADLPAHAIQRPAWQLAEPASPHAAAAAAGVSIDPVRIHAGLAALRRLLPDSPLVVELAGGLLVPFTDPERTGERLTAPATQLDWLVSERPEFVLVARTGLGTLNHTMLSLEALSRRQLRPKALILVGEPHESNRSTLAAWSGLAVFVLPPLVPLSAASLDAWLDENPLGDLFALHL